MHTIVLASNTIGRRLGLWSRSTIGQNLISFLSRIFSDIEKLLRNTSVCAQICQRLILVLQRKFQLGYDTWYHGRNSHIDPLEIVRRDLLLLVSYAIERKRKISESQRKGRKSVFLFSAVTWPRYSSRNLDWKKERNQVVKIRRGVPDIGTCSSPQSVCVLFGSLWTRGSSTMSIVDLSSRLFRGFQSQPSKPRVRSKSIWQNTSLRIQISPTASKIIDYSKWKQLMTSFIAVSNCMGIDRCFRFETILENHSNRIPTSKVIYGFLSQWGTHWTKNDRQK